MNAFAPLLLSSGISARSAWPFGANVVPLNHGSFGAVPTAVAAHRDGLLRQTDAAAVAWFAHTPERVKEARTAIAGFVGAAPGDTAFVPNASAGATVVFNALTLEPGDQILVTDHGYGAVTGGAVRLARRTGATVDTVPIALSDDDDAVVAAFAAAIGDRTRLIVIDQITSATARVLPTARITELAHRHGVRVLVDGAHAPGLIPDAAAAAGGDWWFGNLHKWPCAPRASALLVTKAHDRDTLVPLIDSWFADHPYPDRFDMQGTLDVTTHLTAPVAVSWVEEQFGWEQTRAAISTIADAAANAVAAALSSSVDGDPIPQVHSPAPSMRLVRLPGTLGATRAEADQLRDRLCDATGIECAFTSFRGVGYARLSAHLYTVPDDISTFIDRAVPLLVQWNDEH